MCHPILKFTGSGTLKVCLVITKIIALLLRQGVAITVLLIIIDQSFVYVH